MSRSQRARLGGCKSQRQDMMGVCCGAEDSGTHCASAAEVLMLPKEFQAGFGELYGVYE